MTAYAPHSAHHKKRRERFSQFSPPKALALIHKKPQLVHQGRQLNAAQLRALHAIVQEALWLVP
jgi:hypothetical protein